MEAQIFGKKLILILTYLPNFVIISYMADKC